MARPTKSRNLFVQQCGRGTRLSENKTNCILLDHSGNIHRFGLPTDEPEVDLKGRETKCHVSETKICKVCFAAFRATICPECGTEPPIRIQTPPEESDESLKELDPIALDYYRLKAEAKRTGKKLGWASYRLIDRYTFNVASKYLDKWFLNSYMKQDLGDVFRDSPYVGVKK